MQQRVEVNEGQETFARITLDKPVVEMVARRSYATALTVVDAQTAQRELAGLKLKKDVVERSKEVKTRQ